MTAGGVKRKSTTSGGKIGFALHEVKALEKGVETWPNPTGFVIVSVLTFAGVLAGGSQFGRITAAAADDKKGKGLSGAPFS